MNELIDAIGFLFAQAWRFFVEIDVPGLGISFGTLFIGIFLISFSLRILILILGSNSGSGGGNDAK